MRKILVLLLGAAALAAAPGCGSRDAPVRRYVADLTDVVGGLQQMRNFQRLPKFFAFAPPGTKFSEYGRKLTDDVQAVKDLEGRLSDAEKLDMQLKYGPILDGLIVSMDKEILRLASAQKEPGEGTKAVADAAKAVEPTWVLNGYATVSTAVTTDLHQLAAICHSTVKREQVEAAVTSAREMRYRLAVDAVRMKHLEPRDPQKRDKARAAVRASLAGLINDLHLGEAQVRQLPGGNDVVTAIEPLPAEVTSVAAAPGG